MTEVVNPANIAPTTSTEVATEVATEQQPKEYQDRFLEGAQRLVPYDLLESNGNLSKSTDPCLQVYMDAKLKFKKGYDLCLNQIPRSLEDDVLKEHEAKIREASELMIQAWLMDDRAAPMSERILILGQQYEKVLLREVPESEKEGFFTKESLLFSAWILLVGRQFKHCITTLTLALDSFPELPARVYYLRASCYLGLKKFRLGIKDLEKSLEKDSRYFLSYFVQGTVYMALENERENAIKQFKLYVQNASKETNDYIHALYCLSVLIKSKNHNKKSANNEARNFYIKAKQAEVAFKALYGAGTGLSDTKRQAIQLFEQATEATKMITDNRPKRAYEQKMQQLIQSGVLNFPPNPKSCSHCAASHAKEKQQPLLACGGCRGIWYCSRECQVADFKHHKAQCKVMQQQQQQKQ
ncbi:hypothetical protein K501DRAFT_222555 [Backusella circina FSU 941]|nr:hypothetical protein K501DRAFT_222555 [Backusella circina FSU 941]